MFSDPALWLAVIGWLGVLLLALGWCRAAARGDSTMERERRRREALKKIYADSDAELMRELATLAFDPGSLDRDSNRSREL